MNELIAQVKEVLSSVNQSLSALPKAQLLPGDRQILGGHLQPHGPAVVDQVAAALSRTPEVYATLGTTGAALASRQGEADLWLRLRNLLLGYAQRAADQHTLAQADATRVATAILNDVYGQPAPRAQRDGLLTARMLLLKSQRSSVQQKKAPTTDLSRQRDRVVLQRLFEGIRREGLARGGSSAENVPVATETTPLAYTLVGANNLRKEKQMTDVTEQFLSQLGAEIAEGEGPPGPILPRPPFSAKDALSLQGQASQHKRAVPTPDFTDGSRATMQAQRSPHLMELLRLCGQGLSQAPALAQALGVSADLCARVVSQDSEVGKVIKATGDVYELSQSAAGQRAGQALDRGARAIEVVGAYAVDEAVAPAERGQVELCFAEAFRLRDEVEERAAAAERRVARRLRPLVEARDQARAEVEELRLIDRYLANKQTEET